jgi:hypothetical protein
MKTIKISSIIILIGALLASLLSSCTYSSNSSREDLTKAVHEVEAFDKIVLQGGYQVTLKQSETPLLTIYANDEMHNKIDSYIDNNTLYVKTRGTTINSDNQVIIDISIDKLEKLRAEGGIVLDTEGYISTENIDIILQGGAHIKMKLKANKISAKGEGGVNMQFEGVCNEFTATTEGAGNIDADNLEAKTVTCRVAGVGNASVYATEELHATVEGVGRINYRGNPVVHKNVSGIGAVHRK